MSKRPRWRQILRLGLLLNFGRVLLCILCLLQIGWLRQPRVSQLRLKTCVIIIVIFRAVNVTLAQQICVVILWFYRFLRFARLLRFLDIWDVLPNPRLRIWVKFVLQETTWILWLVWSIDSLRWLLVIYIFLAFNALCLLTLLWEATFVFVVPWTFGTVVWILIS